MKLSGCFPTIRVWTEIMNTFICSVKNLLCRLLSRYFLLLEVPESFQKVASNCNKTIVITQSDSLIIKALLLSFAKRREIYTITRLKDFFAEEEKTNSESYTLYWESLHNEEEIDKIQKEMPDAFISTFNIFEGRGPIYDNPSYKIKKRTLFSVLITPLLGLQRRHFFLFSFGEPFPVSSEKVSPKTKLSRRIKVDIFQNTKLVRGVSFQTREVQERYILAGQEAQRMVHLLTKKLNKSEEEIKEEMRKEFHLMAADPRSWCLALGGVATKHIIKRFPEVSIVGLDNFKQAIKGNPVVLIPMHRSHFDYILISGMLYDLNLRTPLVASGMNLRFWPIGPILAKTGAFYIRRESRQNHIHNFLLQRYITYLIKRGHLQEFFIEGGRSRSGRMLSPKLGLLGIMINAFLKGVRKEILFLPVSISYEYVAEVSDYARQNTGLPKKSENFLGFLKAAKQFIYCKRHGEVIINFGEPLSLAQFHENALEEAGGETVKKKLVGGIGTIVLDRVAEQISPCLSDLTYTALMMAPGYGMRRTKLVKTVQNLAHLCTLMKSCNPHLGDFSPALKRFLNDPEHSFSNLTHDGSISIDKTTGTDEIYYIKGDKRYTGDFYKNSSLHLLYTISLMSLLALEKTSITPENVSALYNLLGQRNIILRKKDITEEAETIIACLQKDGILNTSTDKTEIITFINRESGIFIPALLLNYYESLSWVYSNYIEKEKEHRATTISDQDHHQEEPSCTLNYNEFLKEIQTKLIRSKYIAPYYRTESGSKSTLALAIESSKQNGFISMDSFSQSTITILKAPTAELAKLHDIIHTIRVYLQSEIYE